MKSFLLTHNLITYSSFLDRYGVGKIEIIFQKIILRLNNFCSLNTECCYSVEQQLNKLKNVQFVLQKKKKEYTNLEVVC